jgi:hypothetical protein
MSTSPTDSRGLNVRSEQTSQNPNEMACTPSDGVHDEWGGAPRAKRLGTGARRRAKAEAVPSHELRTIVAVCAASGLTRDSIARGFGISKTQLEKHFSQELQTASLQAITEVVRTLYQMAVSEKHPSATIFFLKSRLPQVFAERVEHSASSPIEVKHTHELVAAAASEYIDKLRATRRGVAASGGTMALECAAEPASA